MPQHPIDDFFRRKLDAEQPAMNASDWAAMSALLDGQPRKRRALWWWFGLPAAKIAASAYLWCLPLGPDALPGNSPQPAAPIASESLRPDARAMETLPPDRPAPGSAAPIAAQALSPLGQAEALAQSHSVKTLTLHALQQDDATEDLKARMPTPAVPLRPEALPLLPGLSAQVPLRPDSLPPSETLLIEPEPILVSILILPLPRYTFHAEAAGDLHNDVRAGGQRGIGLGGHLGIGLRRHLHGLGPFSVELGLRYANRSRLAATLDELGTPPAQSSEWQVPDERARMHYLEMPLTLWWTPCYARKHRIGGGLYGAYLLGVDGSQGVASSSVPTSNFVQTANSGEPAYRRWDVGAHVAYSIAFAERWEVSAGLQVGFLDMLPPQDAALEALQDGASLGNPTLPSFTESEAALVSDLGLNPNSRYDAQWRFRIGLSYRFGARY